jgi:cytochrome c oxidase cbb3-type subunit I
MSATAHVEDPMFLDEAKMPSIEADLIQIHGLFAVLTLLISGFFGAVVALKFVYPDFLSGHVATTWGLLRYNHTQGILFGWLGNAFIAFLYHVTPRLSGHPVSSRKLGWVLFALWNFGIVLPGWALIEANLPATLWAIKPLEWTEFPLGINLVTEVCLAILAYQFVWPYLRPGAITGHDTLYVSAWYIIGGTVFTFLSFPTGSLVPLMEPGAIGAAFSGLWIHDAVGLFVTPFVVATAYWVIPAATGKPIYSHFVSMLGFWGLFFIYPLNGTHHYVYSAIPMDTQRAAIAASAILGFDVLLVVFNQLMSFRGSWDIVWRDAPLRFVFTGVVFYLLVSIQGSLQASMAMQRHIHFTDWVIGHSHLAMLGFATFIAAGGIGHAWQRLPDSQYHAGWMDLAYWLIFGGLMLMVGDLTIAGLVQAYDWESGRPWIVSVVDSKAYWIIRVFSALPILTGFAAFLPALYAGPVGNSSVAGSGAAE